MSAEQEPGAPNEPAPPPARDWRRHPLLRRLPVLVLVVVGFALWDWTKVPERELVWNLDGPGWAGVRGLEVQVLDAQDALLKREERFFSGPPPSQLVVPLQLREGHYRARFFLRTDAGTLPPRLEPFTVGPEPRVEHSLYLSARR
ncbi:hypothetical protein FGE12_00770 [Aggregicoccus sp. 17bor-14]|uniref:hypothetical protein n=1 Tax=Myxococcaceae TaxID=31 RepID=UPI00129C1885|nr:MULTISPECIES: hypothetical protein [Myxococcaceae]MBF5040904.1 hypothetical protein [Simulacricoccus sp. 17bor-14]MRI86692.1 hypothetical protein [Aggregicoccus sp. 17bor-14]